MLKRRTALQLVTLGGGALLLHRVASAQLNPYAPAKKDDFGTVRPASWKKALPIPPVLEPLRRDADADIYEVVVKPGRANPLDGAATEILGVNGSWPGPTLRAERGRAVKLRLRNGFKENLSLHNHGMSTLPNSDGHPVDYVRPGAVKEYVYGNDQRGGTLWYHDHVLSLTGPHVYRGFAGFYLLHDPAEDALGLPSGEFDVPIMLQDRLFTPSNALAYRVDSSIIFKGFLGNVLCVNGVHCPHFDVARGAYRLRLLNGSNSRNLKLALSQGSMIQIASDGALLAAPVTRPHVELSPGERADIVVDFSRARAGEQVLLRNLDQTWPLLPDVLRFHVQDRSGPSFTAPARLAEVERLRESDATVRRTVKFALDDGIWTLNGLRYDPSRVDFKPKRGATELWTIHNAENTQLHPFHLHAVNVQVLEVDGKPPPPELQGWKDTVAVGPGSKVRLLVRFDCAPGLYVFHCHKFDHEDHAMMLQQEIIA